MPEIIEKVELFKIDLPLHEPFKIAVDTYDYAGNVFVKLTTKSGIVGFGECSPFQVIHGETQETCFEVGKKLAQLLKGRDALAIEHNLPAMDRYISGNPCIKSAFDMALYDVAARKANMPLYEFLGGRKMPNLDTDMTVSLDEVNIMAANAAKFKRAGFPAIKVKLGTTAEEDIRRIAAVREAVGYDLPIRIDANQGWTIPAAVRALRGLERFDIEYCEAPIPKKLFLELPRVRASTAIPIMADESLFDHFDALNLIRIDAVDFFNIKLSKSGGIFNALKIEAIGQAAGIACQVGCFLESRLGITALAHFASAKSNVLRYDMDSPLMLSEDPVSDGVTYGEKGKIILGSALGVGAVVKPEALESAKEVFAC